MRLIERIWNGNSAADRIARLALAPLEGIYRSAIVARAELYDRGILAVAESPIAVVSVGNITVGGTGKTPVAAWIAARVRAHGRTPAIVLRGYGDDEPLVHARLNPGVKVIVARDRREGIAGAVAAGADVAVLDDGFQHRKASRDLDLVLVSADDWTDRRHILPAGPYREPLSALRRASSVLVTRKAASDDQVAAVVRAVTRESELIPVVVMRLALSRLVSEKPRGASNQLNSIRSKRVLAVAALGNPEAFFRQLEAAGAHVTRMRYRDHHAFSADDVARITSAGVRHDHVICTLKDAVKLGPIWPDGQAPLWYVSLSVEVESGAAVLDEMLTRLPPAHSPVRSRRDD